ncbi:MAG: gliding motility-associated C-terminal domain-containing protein [Bacteroidia bacterium]|nr:gliding motility-associated C-terminal domain-containing protein [Bacteroidia bacterium]
MQTAVAPFLLFFFSLIFSLFPVSRSFATHAMGVDLTYQCLGGNQYQITLAFYRDCAGITTQPTYSIGVRSVSCGVNTTLTVNQVSAVDISPLCPAQKPNSSCQGGFLPGVEQYIYTGIITLPANCSDWVLSWSQCCRNSAITNAPITSISGGTETYVEATLNNLTVNCNSSPVFTSIPTPYVCAGEPILYNNGAVDPDGDSLAYELVNPLELTLGVPTQVLYYSPFSPAYPISTTPPNSFGFDPASGQISFTPGSTQQSIVTVLVKQYRNGVLIGTTMRDLQIVVINCLNDPPVLNPPAAVSGGNLNGNTFTVCAGNTLSFTISASDNNAADQLSGLTNLASTIPGATLNITGTNPLTATFSWPTTVADVGSHSFTVTVADNACPVFGQQVVGYLIYVQDEVSVMASDTTICPGINQSVQLAASVNGSPGNGSFSWTPAAGLSNPNIANPVATVSGPGTYSVTYTEGVCVSSANVNIISEATLAVTPSNPSICLGNTVALNASLTFNVAPSAATYLWTPAAGLNNPNIAAPTASPTTNTNYSLTVTTPTCVYSTVVPVTVSQPPSLNPFSAQAICAGTSVPLSAGGTNLANSTFIWTPSTGLSNATIANPVASPTTSTNYTLTVSNLCGSDNETISISVLPKPVASLTATPLTCSGANDGSVSASVTGGTPGYNYAWTPAVGITPVVNNLSAGNYSVIVSDANNCADTAQIAVTSPSPLLLSLVAQTNPGCFGDSSGVFMLSASGGSGGYEFSLDGINYQSAAAFTNLPAGFYPVSVRDVNNCITNSSVNITQPGPLTAIISESFDSDCLVPTGSFSVSANGGGFGYQYSIDGINFVPTGTFSNLAPGIYTVTIRDGNNCETQIVTTVSAINAPTATLVSQTNLLCNGTNTGALTVSASGGILPYQFSLDNNNFSPSGTFSGLTAGSYVITVKDSNSCPAFVQVTLTEPSALAANIFSTTPADCPGAATGSVVGFGSGGTGSWQYSVDGVNFVSGNGFPGLSAGNYTFTVRDANGCEATAPFIITEPLPIGATIAALTDVDCSGNATGSVTLLGTGGNGGFEYSSNGINWQVSGTFSGLAAGAPGFFIRDSVGCEATTSVTISEPLPLSGTVTALADVDCNGNNTGSFTLSGTGGTAPYLYAPDGVNFSVTNTFSGLVAGTYTTTIRDANGCESVLSSVISEPPIITLSFNGTNASCFGFSDGNATAVVSGGAGGYSYLWNNNSALNTATVSNLPAATYTLLVTDQNGCVATGFYVVNEPPAISLQTSLTPETCSDDNGTATVIASGGTGSFSYVWQTIPPQMTAGITSLDSGTYTVIVTDQNNCSATTSVSLIDEAAPILSPVNILDASCWGLNDGSAQVIATGGTGNYTYSWSTGANGSTITGLASGTYLAIVNDGQCTTELEVLIGEPEELVVVIDSFGVPLCFGSNEGFVGVSVSGGTGPYSIVWNGGTFPSTPNLSGLGEGTYAVNVVDINGCNDTASIFLDDPLPLETTLSPEDVKCFGENNGSITTLAGGGTPPYSYNWSNGGSSVNVTHLVAGIYSVSITDSNGCTIQGQATVNQPEALVVSAAFTDVNCFGGADGSAQVSVSGGTAGYAYLWSNGTTNSQLSGVSAGSYGVVVRDRNGCETAANGIIHEPDQIEVVAVETVSAFCLQANGSVLVDVSGGIPAYTYQWQTSPPQEGPLATDLWGNQSYTVLVTDAKGCSESFSVTIPDEPPAIADFVADIPADKPLLLSQGRVQFTNQSQFAVAYEWSFGDNPGIISNVENPVHTYTEPGIYTVKLTAFDPHFSCADTISLTFEIVPDGVIFIPNAFTPNGDGNNDVFYFFGEGLVSVEMDIFDRWGTKVRTLYNLSEGWDGYNDKGSAVQEGVYVYALNALLNNGTNVNRGGTITLIR